MGSFTVFIVGGEGYAKVSDELGDAGEDVTRVSLAQTRAT